MMMADDLKPNSEDKILIKADPDIADMIPQFLENRRKDVAALQQAFEKENMEAITFLSHKMAGAGSGYGFDDMSRISKSMELAAKTGSVETARKHLQELAAYLERVQVVYE